MIMMDVPQILQKPELPNGCEITSCCEVLNFLGYKADKCDLADHYLPRSRFWYGADPDRVYMGDPHRDDDDPETGYYCFAGPVVEAANAFIAGYSRNARPLTAMEAVDITGALQPDLERHLRAGRPFIFWASLHFEDIQYDPCGGYDLPDGGYHRVFHQLHCMVCKGMDEEYFYIADPLDYNEKVPKAQFMKIYRQLGSRAVVFLPADRSWRRMAGKQRVPGFLPCGERNAITDVPGVKVGHYTCTEEGHNTGVTVILPREDVFSHKCVAAVHVINGYGKSAGLVQIQELGELESPIALTNTLNVGLVWDALVGYMVRDREEKGSRLRSFNPVVGECNDASLNTITRRIVGEEQVLTAIRQADEIFAQGCAGAGTGMTCHGLKGGIGSASRHIRLGGQTYTLGVLSLCNHGELRELRLPGMEDAGIRLGEALRKRSADTRAMSDKGSCIIVLATDLPLSARQLGRVIRRCGAGMARCGSYFGHGSGDIVIGFTTAHDLGVSPGEFTELRILKEDLLDRAFAAATEAAWESVLNALSSAATVTGPDGTVRYSLWDLAAKEGEER